MLEVDLLISRYGYFALTGGTMIEGETFLFLGALAAFHGVLSIKLVILAGYIGAVIGDLFFFTMGRVRGRAFLETRPVMKARSEKVLRLLMRHKVPVLLGYRFVYGFRGVTPFVFGLTSMPAKYFIAINAVVALVWTVVVSAVGYYAGEFLKGLGVDYHHLRWAMLAAVVLIPGGCFVLRTWRKKRAKKAKTETGG